MSDSKAISVPKKKLINSHKQEKPQAIFSKGEK